MTCMVEKRVWDWLLPSLGLLTDFFFFFKWLWCWPGLCNGFYWWGTSLQGERRFERLLGAQKRTWKKMQRLTLETSQKKLRGRWYPRKEGLYGKIQMWKKSQPRWWLTARITKLSSHWRQWKLHSSNEDGCQ